MKSKISSLYYIAELNLPNKSAYSIHVMKMCEAFSKLGYKTNLLNIKNTNLSKIFNVYNIKYNFKLISIFNKSLNLNFILRLVFTYKILTRNFEKNSIFISRSIIFALIASTIKKNVILELHHQITGFTRVIFNFLKFTNLTKNLKFIFLHKRLKQFYNIQDTKCIILDDAADIENFKNQKNRKKLKNTCVYIGSFFEGKGIEQILRLAKLNKRMFFHLYGEKKYFKFQNIEKNIKVFDYVSYSKIPKILTHYEVALMPYQFKVKGRSSIWIENYMSPLKMFDYLASKMIIVASDLSVYKHILRNNFNCKLIEVNNDKKWSEALNHIFKDTKINNFLKKNAFKTVQNFTWEKRCQKIIHFSKVAIY
jgi:glycosyltransferase involved in cell wall biosynthesis